MENTKLKFSKLQVNELIGKLQEKQKSLNEGEYLELSTSLLELLLFKDEAKTELRENVSFKGLDLSNISFSGVDISGRNFTGSKGAKINPQTVKNKDCSRVNFNGVTFTGSFDDCVISDSRFSGSIGAKINPQKIKDKNFVNVVLEDVEITGSFDDCHISNANFKGSKGAKINPQKLRKEYGSVKSCKGVNFADVEITGTFGNCIIEYASFQGSTGAKIDPQMIKGRNCKGVNFADAEITGSFYDCEIDGAKFKGSKGAKIRRTCITDVLSNIDFADVEFLDIINAERIYNSSFQGSKNAVIEIYSSYNISRNNFADTQILCDNDKMDEVFQELKDNRNILTETTTLNGIKACDYTQARIEHNRLFDSYLGELKKSPQPTLKVGTNKN